MEGSRDFRQHGYQGHSLHLSINFHQIMKHSTTFAFIHYRPYQCKCRDTLHGTDTDFWWDFC